MIGLSWVMAVLGWLSYPYTYYFDHFGAFLHIVGCLRHDPVKKMCTTSEVYIHPGGMPQVWA